MAPITNVPAIIESLLYSLLVFRLVGSLFSFFTQLALIKISRLKILLISIAIFLFSLAYFFNQLKIETPQPQTLISSYPATLNSAFFNQKTTFSRDNLERDAQKLQQALEKQPTHQGLLLNLAIETQLLDEETNKSSYLINQAFEINPNSPIFNRE